jgi:hypothetical protein
METEALLSSTGLAGPRRNETAFGDAAHIVSSGGR